MRKGLRIFGIASDHKSADQRTLGQRAVGHTHLYIAAGEDIDDSAPSSCLHAPTVTLTMSFDITEAQLFALAFECMSYGALLLTTWDCVTSLIFTDNRYQFNLRDARNIRWFLLVCSFLLFAIGTLDVAMGLKSCLNAFVYRNDGLTPNEVFHDISDPVSVTKVCIFHLSQSNAMTYTIFQIADVVASATVGDAVLVSTLIQPSK